MVATVINSFVGDATKAKGRRKKGGPHVVARSLIKAVFAEKTEPKVLKKKKHYLKPPNIIQYEMDCAIQSKCDNKEVIYYRDDKGIDMTYPGGSEIRCLSDLEIVTENKDTTNFNVILGHSKENPDAKTFVVLKVSEQQTAVQYQPMMNNHRVFLKKLLDTMPNVNRGEVRCGVTRRYVCFGLRKNPLDRQLGEYAFKQGVSDADKETIKKGIRDLVKVVEKCSMIELRRAGLVGDGHAGFVNVQSRFRMPSINPGGVATQLALAQGYCSPVHVDDDVFYSSLSCYDSENQKKTDKGKKRKTVYHFCFPTYGLAIPMKSGDIILFNPLVPHCTTNPRVETALIYSLYVSSKTCNTHVANLEDKE